MPRQYYILSELHTLLQPEVPGLDLADLAAHVRSNGFPREKRKGRVHYGLTDADLDGLRSHFSPAAPEAPPAPASPLRGESLASPEPPAPPTEKPPAAAPADLPAFHGSVAEYSARFRYAGPEADLVGYLALLGIAVENGAFSASDIDLENLFREGLGQPEAAAPAEAGAPWEGTRAAFIEAHGWRGPVHFREAMEPYRVEGEGKAAAYRVPRSAFPELEAAGRIDGRWRGTAAQPLAPISEYAFTGTAEHARRHYAAMIHERRILKLAQQRGMRVETETGEQRPGTTTTVHRLYLTADDVSWFRSAGYFRKG